MQKSFKDQKATLYLVSTPIGHLKDITIRAIETLQTVDAVFAEDTRTSMVLFQRHDIKKPLFSYHEHNKLAREQHILDMLADNKHVALISDAGTPGISDPGYEIAQAVIAAGYHVVAIPGPSAILAALVSAGLIMQPFTFVGFLPKKQQEAKRIVETYVKRKETLVIFESPMRIPKTLTLLHQVLGNRRMALARELTKTFETIIRTDLVSSLDMTHATKGEYVIVIEGDLTKETFEDESVEERVNHHIQQGATEKDALKLVAKERGMSKSDIYKIYKIDRNNT
ncbi:MAG: 16S rRNA (cytidine(1402)-2'-O)-methyltransferase [Acholeplasmataceae bacterium]|nr:MAG: 16S rRNA (cytidine(1402)-2'-O)-methyltransferase [Acholeplasmataceae bacterium]